MTPITFCIATAKNEKEYIRLLLESLAQNTEIEKHFINVFIDSDNQDTYTMLKEMQKEDRFAKMLVCKNPNIQPIGGQRNISIMFNESKTDIVCYLQSDMVVGKDIDKHILSVINENTVVSCTRIEPPLHPESPEKITKDFGLTPDSFKKEEFNNFIKSFQEEKRSHTNGHFAPFAIYKSTWFDKLGGFDTQFRCSREDSDMIIRMNLCGLETIQSWKACVYHFTCVSSRGTDWFNTKSEESQYKNELQQQADLQELKRFIRKWGYFGHEPKPFYNISFDIDIDRYVDLNVLKWIEPFCSRLYVSDESIAYQLASQIKFESYYYSNLRWNYTTKHWFGVESLFNPTDFHTKIKTLEPNITPIEDIIISFKYSEFLKGFNDELKSVIENINEVVDQNEIGKFQYGPLIIDIKRKTNLTPTMLKVKNTDTVLNHQKFAFT
jgi:GT2 family glycosyltransferase